MRVDLALLPPALVSAEVTCLVVDVLRATSVQAVLFGRGVRALWPAADIEAGRRLRAALVAERPAQPPGGVLLIGEEHALPPTGYDYGNSPLALERAALTAEMVHATTNGTPALLACREAALTLPAAPLNAAAAVRAAIEAGHDVLVVCSGLYGAPAEDDALAGGLLVERLVRAGAQPGIDAASALERYEAVRGDFAAALRATEHGRNLVSLGFGPDVDRCAAVDAYDVAAILHMQGGRAVLRPLP